MVCLVSDAEEDECSPLEAAGGAAASLASTKKRSHKWELEGDEFLRTFPGRRLSVKALEEEDEDAWAGSSDVKGGAALGGRAAVGAPAGLDPLPVLGKELFQKVLSLLGPSPLGSCLWVSTSWRHLAQGDPLWAPHCARLWANKMSVPDVALADGLMPRVQAYVLSIEDSKREVVTGEDLCRFTWDFRFQWNCGGIYRFTVDPSWAFLPKMERHFEIDGSIAPGRNDHIFGDHESRWEILLFREALGSRPRSLVRVNHWPPLEVRRTPDWGWELDNGWVVYRTKAHRRPPPGS